MNQSRDTDVLIVGAGPTGLVLALWLTRLGVRVRIIDKTAEPGTTSRALAVQARTLEFYSQIGLSDAVVAQGRKTIAANMWVAGKRAARAVLGEMGEGLSPFPYALIFPQDEHEQLLIERLGEVGIQIERRTELITFQDDGSRVLAELKRPDGSQETCEAAYIAGCDGAHSTVREKLQIGFPGGIYNHLFYVADVEASGATMNGELHIALDSTDFLVVFAVKGRGARAADRDSAPGSRTATRRAVLERREPPGTGVDQHRRKTGELVLDVPRAPSGRGSFARGFGLPARGRSPHP